MKIALVIPTIRNLNSFSEAWTDLIIKHKADVIAVYDGEEPYALVRGRKYFPEEILGDDADLIYNLNDGVRNFGFVMAAHLGYDIVISLDDDVIPDGDTIQDHINALSQNWPITWFSTADEYMRGFPYNVRQEAPCWVSHGVWKGVPDLDGPSQLIFGPHEVKFPKCPVPKGILFPFCAMNFAIRKEALAYIYQAPMGKEVGLDRFADIWGGVELKKDMDTLGKAVVTGFASVTHLRASNVYKNLQKEAKGIELNDHYGEDEYFKLFHEKRARWKNLILNIQYNQK
jgi:reversibly glycosylated polypeptide/UDP-arabinopyranose mutase